MSLPWANADSGRFAAGNRAAEVLKAMLEGLGATYLSEVSAKCRPGHWSTQRCLFSLPVSSVGPQRLAAALHETLATLGMCEADREAFLVDLADPGEAPHFLHLGVEDDRCKVYWEADSPSDPLPAERRHVMYRAWKWRADERAASSDYVLLPTAREARVAIEAELERHPECPMHDVIEQLQVSFALAQITWPPVTVRIEEMQAGEPTGRDSLNLHLHRAGLPLGTLAGPMFALAREWQSTPRQTLIDWMARHGSETLSNLSFGRGATGEPFVTCYHGTKRHLTDRTEAPRRSDRIPGATPQQKRRHKTQA
ncbi:hypothetical protein [Halomonas faecis]|uniref:hypothetical protein n=1 Tax=Halomonas faecis TaxID=1562110 RepID=UPI0013D4F874|nr:hypothetical protein [Halomonas faecis]